MFNEIPPHLMRLDLLSLNDAALISVGFDPMIIGDCERAEKENWAGWEIAKANREALLQAVALKKIRPVSATVWVSSDMDERNIWEWVAFDDMHGLHGWEEEIDVDTITVKHLNSLRNAIFHRDDVLAFFGYQTKPEEATTGPSQAESQPQQGCSINSPTFAKLIQVIEAFPVQYPDYKTNPPKLNDDVRPWMVKSFGCTKNKEDHVFGRIVKEHFQLKD